MRAGADLRSGMRSAVPLVVPTLALGASFGVLAEPVMGPVAPLVMSVLVFSGGAQFATLSVLQAQGSAGAAMAAGVLMNARWLPMSFAIAPSLTGGRARRSVEAQAIVDASFVIADRGDGTFSRDRLIGATIPQVSAWVAGTALGLVVGSSLPSPDSLGLDAVFPAFYLTLLVAEVTGTRAVVVVALAAAVTLALMPFAPGGIAVIAASAAALVGLRRA
jgi:4-azaleucine resistance transporter AzlC